MSGGNSHFVIKSSLKISMKSNYAHYLKHENSIKALLHVLHLLHVHKMKTTRFGYIMTLSEGDMELFYKRMYNHIREQ